MGDGPRSGGTHGEAGALAAPLAAEELRELRHEVGNALTAASIYAQVLLRRMPSWADELDYRALRGVADSVDRASRLVHRRPSGAAAAAPPIQDLAVLLERISREVPPERWPDLRVRCLGGPLLGRWNAGCIEQVLVNLLVNAAKYSPPGTPIEVEASRLGCRGWARIVVRDHGIGVEEEALETIFAGHRTARAQQTAPGSGLGLRLSRRLVEAEGGLLWAMNVPGGGSAFYAELPLIEPDEAARRLSDVPNPATREWYPLRPEQPMVLLVEDDASRTVAPPRSPRWSPARSPSSAGTNSPAQPVARVV